MKSERFHFAPIEVGSVSPETISLFLDRAEFPESFQARLNPNRFRQSVLRLSRGHCAVNVFARCAFFIPVGTSFFK
jgi:hypothetical protein